MSSIARLISSLDRSRRLVIQAHDFPDHDAVAAGNGLLYLLALQGVKAELCYSGRIQSTSLTEAIRLLNIPIRAASELRLEEDTQLILVDGFIGNRNVSDLPGEVIAVIDHHEPPEKPDVVYFDIRPEAGSTSTIVYGYFKELGIVPSKDVSTSLLMGLMMDTAFMTRGVHRLDLEAFSDLFFEGDWKLGSRLLKNSLSLGDLQVFREALNLCQVVLDFCFIPLQKECSPEVAALIGDFFLGLREINFVVVLVPDRDEYRLSVRSDRHDRPADIIIRRALESIGSGGGHMHMGGGQIPMDLFPGEQTVRMRFLQSLGLLSDGITS